MTHVRPLDHLGSIKLKLGAVILGSVVTTVATLSIGYSLRWPVALRVALALLLSLAIVQLLSRGMTSPLREMAAAARAMARGDYSRRVHATSRDEVGELARAFNTMAAELAAIDRTRRDFVANASHELRTPITALQAVLENIVDGVTRPNAATLRSMLRQTQRLTRLVDQLLDLSRLESGAVPVERHAVPLSAFLRDVVADVATGPLAATGRPIPTVRVEPADLTVSADPERLHQVLSNLLDNALRHSPNGTPVEVTARESRDRVILEVSDDGPGIPAAEAKRVFERFYRRDTGRAESDGGSGLGLAIAQGIVELHGGDIRIAANTPRGCRVVVELPKVAT
ncbi:MAG: HAMP domain-containing protein [Frankia sp.]|nr:HAMP domain-containing protein [Frankia sp.]